MTTMFLNTIKHMKRLLTLFLVCSKIRTVTTTDTTIVNTRSENTKNN